MTMPWPCVVARLCETLILLRLALLALKAAASLSSVVWRARSSCRGPTYLFTLKTKSWSLS